MNDQQVICILGMHRSGTSLVSRVLNVLGVFLAPQHHLMGATQDNPRGYWENQLLTKLNEDILARFDGSWHEPPTLEAGWEKGSELADLRQRARIVIQKDFGKETLWGWKDPRSCITLPFWQALLPSMKYIICLRNPLDVARSLATRDGFPFKKSLGLWLSYVTSSIKYTAGQPTLVLFYEDLMANPVEEVGRMRKFIGLPLDASWSDRLRDINEYIDETLQHYRTPPARLLEDSHASFSVKALYTSLRHYRNYFDKHDDVDHSNEHFGTIVGLSSSALLAHRQQSYTENQLKELRRELQTVNQLLQAQRGALDEVCSTFAWLVTSKFRRIKDRYFLPGTARRSIYDVVLSSLKHRLKLPRINSQVPVSSSAFTPQHGNGAVANQLRDSAGIHSASMPGSSRGTPIRRKLVGHCEFAIYTSSSGNYFFSELGDLLAAGLRRLGLRVSVQDEHGSFSVNADWHLVVAPHEFFYLGRGSGIPLNELSDNLILYNTEQPSTEWYSRASKYFHKATQIWDIDYNSCAELRKQGLACEYVPLGYETEHSGLCEVEQLPHHYGTCFLSDRVRTGNFLNRPLRERPIDVLFLGTLSPKREKFFAESANIISRFHSYIYLPSASSPLITGFNTHMDTLTSVGLAQRAKIVLNVHRGEDTYFEWHRIVMHGLWQKALVISEPTGAAPPFKPGVDFVEAELQRIPEMIEHYLTAGRQEAQEIATQGFLTLSENCRLSSRLQPLVAKLLPCAVLSRRS